MIIETKHNIGDEVWFIEENEPNNDIIVSIEINVYKGKVSIAYLLLFANDRYREDTLFPTKEELLKSL